MTLCRHNRGGRGRLPTWERRRGTDMTDAPPFYLRRGETASEPFDLVITPQSAGWEFTGLSVLSIPPGGSVELHTGMAETLVLPLEGGCAVSCAGESHVAVGR